MSLHYRLSNYIVLSECDLHLFSLLDYCPLKDKLSSISSTEIIWCDNSFKYDMSTFHFSTLPVPLAINKFPSQIFNCEF